MQLYIDSPDFILDYEEFTLPEYRYGRDYDNLVNEFFDLGVGRFYRLDYFVSGKKSVDGIARNYTFIVVYNEDNDLHKIDYAGYVSYDCVDGNYITKSYY